MAEELGAPLQNPFNQIFAVSPQSRCFKVASWPKGLGFDTDKNTGLCIPFAWPAMSPMTLSRVPGTGFREIYERAAEAGKLLSHLVKLVHLIAPERQVDVVAHSLGARVALEASDAGARFDRMILLSGAETAKRACDVLAKVPDAQVFNFSTDVNAAYEALFAVSMPGSGRTLSKLPPLPNVVTAKLDRWDVRDALAQLGYPIAAPERRICHWSTYTARGALAFYSALLRQRKSLSIPLIESHLDVMARVRAA
jgi:pimeloyl-ACP methyl ester carboxylesterase